MVQALSRFPLDSPTGPAAAEVLDRTRPGCLGLEVFPDHEDESRLYLLTRWTDALACRNWHASHRELVLLHLLERPDDAGTETAVANSVPLLASFLASAQSVLLLEMTTDNVVLEHNQAASLWLDDDPSGKNFDRYLDDHGRTIWQERLQAGRYGQAFRLNVHTPSERVHTLRCELDRQGTRVVLLAEVEISPDYWAQMQTLQQDLVLMTRDQVRTSRGQAREFERFKASHWHLARLQEYMTICTGCGLIQAKPGEWCDLVQYLRANDLWFSHGYCPECATPALAEIGLLDDQTITKSQ